MGEIERLAGHERIEIVAADPPLHLGKARHHFLRLARAERKKILRQRQERRMRIDLKKSVDNGPKCSGVPSASTASSERTLSRMVP